MHPDENTPDELSPEAYAEFIKIYREEFPEDKVSDDDLRIRAVEVLRLFALLVKALPDKKVASDHKKNAVSS